MAYYARTILVTGPRDEVEPAAAAHREHLGELERLGKLHIAGEFANGDGFLDIIEVADLHEAEELARRSPLIELGLGSWMLREWKKI
jgi:uncharacterized protein YciI